MVSPDTLFYRKLPKAELHAHLNGSIRPSTLVELVSSGDHVPSTAAQATIRDVLPSPNRSLSDCFRIFDLIHSAVRDEHSLRRITREMVHDCAHDGVTYLEIRTTPRPIGVLEDGDDGLENYTRVVIETLASVEECGLGITVRLLLSINRASCSTAIAARTIQLAAKYSNESISARLPGCEQERSCPDCDATSPRISKAHADAAVAHGPYVVGVELSGDPTRGSAADFLPALQAARDAGLRVSVHCGETMNVRETEAVLDWRPDRLGHMCVLSHTSVARMMALPPGSRIPIEVCPTSNALTLHLPSLHHHPTLNPWLTAGYPIAICTDDSGVFGVSLSDEYREVAGTYGLSKERMAQMAVDSFRHAFVDEPTKARLVAHAQSRADELLSSQLSTF